MSRQYNDRMISHEGKAATWPDVAPQTRKTGTIAHWNRERAWGFLRRSDGKPDLFVHLNRVVDDVEELAIGQRVSFEVGANPRNQKPEAIDVRVID